jgi:hypothetical protein
MPPKTHAAKAAFFFPPKAALFLSEVFEKSVGPSGHLKASLNESTRQ